MHPELKRCLAFHEKGQNKQAEAGYRAYLKKHANDDHAHFLLGRFLVDAQQYEEAEKHFAEALKAKPEHPIYHEGMGEILRCLGRLSESIPHYAQALALNLGSFVSLKNLHELCESTGNTSPAVVDALESSLARFKRRVDEEPNHFEHLREYARALTLVVRNEECISVYKRMLELEPENFKLLNNLATIYQKMGRKDDSINCSLKAIAIKPESAALHVNLGCAYQLEKSPEAAIASLKMAIYLDPKLVEARMNLANLYWKINEMEKALHECHEVLRVQPDFSGAFNLMGILYSVLGEEKASANAYLNALKSRPTSTLFHSNYLLSLNYTDISNEDLYREHLKYAERFQGAVDYSSFTNTRDPRKKLRIGYVSNNFCWHSVAFFFHALAKSHNRDQVEVHCYSKIAVPDEMTDLIESLSDHYVNIHGMTSAAIADLIRQDEIDVLVDLQSHTGNSLLPVFGRKPAPVQVSWLGYPNTTGMSQMDYRLSDSITEPEGESDDLSSEKIYRIEEGFHNYRMPDGAHEPSVLPVLKNNYITFGSFNNSSKISQKVMLAWSRILTGTPGSRLFIKNRGYMHEGTKEKVLKFFEEQGVSRERIDIADHTLLIDEHLRYYDQVDITLDTFPYNGTTTTIESLYMGVPTVNLLGTRHAGRVTASILEQVGLEDWIANDIDGYVELAINKSRDIVALKQLRETLRGTVQESALFDYSTFADKIETAFREMWAIFCNNHGGDKTIATAVLRETEEKKKQFRERKYARKAHRARKQGDNSKLLNYLLESLNENAEQPELFKQVADLLHKGGRREEALDYYSKAITHFSTDPLLFANKGSCLQELGRFEESLECFEKALGLNKNLPGVWLNYGEALNRLNRYSDAREAFNNAIELKPDFAEAHSNMGSLLKNVGDLDSSVSSFCTAHELQAGSTEIYSNLLMALNYVPGLGAEELLEHHQSWQTKYQSSSLDVISSNFPRLATENDVLRIAYVSPDLHSHSISFFMESVLKGHDPDKVEVFIYSDAAREDETSGKLKKLSDHWLNTQELSHGSLHQKILDDGIDVLVDLAGHTANNRLPVFALRAAPVQLSWLGYPMPTGLFAIDHFVGDKILSAGEGSKFLVLEEGAHCYSIPKSIPDVSSLPANSNGYITFVCCNNFSKINATTLDAWAEILKQISGSKLSVKCKQFKDTEICQEFIEAMADRGIEASRLVLHAWSENANDRWHVYEQGDIALDTFPYNGVTTSCDALSMGLPVVTCNLGSYASRFGESLLNQLGESDWATHSIEAYIEKALELSKDTAALSGKRSSLRNQFKQSSLGNPARLIPEAESVFSALFAEKQKHIQPMTQEPSLATVS